MSQSRHRLAPSFAGSGTRAVPASKNRERGRTHGLPFILWLLEQRLIVLLALPTFVAAIAMLVSGRGWPVFVGTWLLVPFVGVFLPLLLLVYRSHRHDAGSADPEAVLNFRDQKLQKRWRGKKIPMEVLYEAYMAEKLDFSGDVYETLKRRNQFFRFCFTWGDVKFYFREFLTQNLTHSRRSDEADIAHVYNRGNDFYNWFLGDGMVYTSGIFEDPSETLDQAQARKLDIVCRSVHMKPGDQHLDIGCGWGPLIVHAAKEYGAISTGVTLAEEQANWANERARKAGVADRVRVIVDD